ncbi:hypothetical protein [Cumulibacter soli]|uniref:hypothetical protein n=1 Tax=Cumulibacter soli TaxID=2546344 RepID=UPI001067B840|nr:hypothetical protein [Cumulibacter soli]
MRRIFTPGWIAWHIFAILALAGCLWAFQWQLSRAEGADGDWQNWLYAIQWPMFAAMGVAAWVRAIYLAFRPPGHDEPPLLHHDDPDPGRIVHEVRPKAIAMAPHYDEYHNIADPELEAYNERLRVLNQQAGIN